MIKHNLLLPITNKDALTVAALDFYDRNLDKTRLDKTSKPAKVERIDLKHCSRPGLTKRNAGFIWP